MTPRWPYPALESDDFSEFPARELEIEEQLDQEESDLLDAADGL